MNEISQLRQQGLSISRISEITGFDRKTVRKYLHANKPPVYPRRAPRPRLLDAYGPFLEERLAAGVWNGVVLWRELRAQGYTGGYTAVKDYLRPLRRQADCVAVRRFETPPGKQGQVDWGDLGTITYPDGTKQTLSGFVFTLGHSRALFAEVTTDQKLSTLLALHEKAFVELGGVPEEILYDNMKTVVLQTLTEGVDERGEIRFNPTFLDFARYWGFTPRLCRPYRPQTKGKVESGVKYLRRNFLCGRQATSLCDLNAQLRVWLAQVANVRTHGSTHRVIVEAWEAEKPFLQPVGTRPPYPRKTPDVVRKVAADGYVAFDTNRYPLPWRVVGQTVVVRCTEEQVSFLLQDVVLVTHPRQSGRYQTLPAGALHQDMPYGPTRTRRKLRLSLIAGAPLVQQRDLQVYMQAAGCEEEERVA